MKRNSLFHRALLLGAGINLWLASVAPAAVILQSSGANSVAFEAEANVSITPGTPTSFVITNDATPSGSTALFTSGPLGGGTDYPRGFASYSIKFSTAGFYKRVFRKSFYESGILLAKNYFLMAAHFSGGSPSSN